MVYNLKWYIKIVIHQKWNEVFKNGPSKICGREPLKILTKTYLLTFFKGCLPQFLLGPFLNTCPKCLLIPGCFLLT